MSISPDASKNEMLVYYSGGPFKTKHFSLSTEPTPLNEGETSVIWINAFDTSKLIKKSDSYSLISEYTIGRKINNPNFMKVYRLFKKIYTDEEGEMVNWVYKLEVERISGDILGNVLSSRKMDGSFYLKLAKTLGDAIHYLNQQHIAWDDLHDKNIMVSHEGQIKFIDFDAYFEEKDDKKRVVAYLENYQNLLQDIAKREPEVSEEMRRHTEKLLSDALQEIARGAPPQSVLKAFLDSSISR